MIDMIMNLPFRQTTMKYFMKKMLWLIIVIVPKSTYTGL